jgi:hypothetical protein
VAIEVSRKTLVILILLGSAGIFLAWFIATGIWQALHMM